MTPFRISVDRNRKRGIRRTRRFVSVSEDVSNLCVKVLADVDRLERIDVDIAELAGYKRRFVSLALVECSRNPPRSVFLLKKSQARVHSHNLSLTFANLVALAFQFDAHLLSCFCKQFEYNMRHVETLVVASVVKNLTAIFDVELCVSCRNS